MYMITHVADLETPIAQWTSTTLWLKASLLNRSTWVSILWAIISSFLVFGLVLYGSQKSICKVLNRAVLLILFDCWALISFVVKREPSTKALFLFDLSWVRSLCSLKAFSKKWKATGKDSWIGTELLSSMFILKYSIPSSAIDKVRFSYSIYKG